MKNIILVLNNEWKSFVRSDKSVFIIYAILIGVWSLFLASNIGKMEIKANTFWWVFFSVIVSGNFSNAIFISERLSGAMEIILTCGLSRKEILAGKQLFVIIMSVLIGGLCYGFGVLWVLISSRDAVYLIRSIPFWDNAAIYVSACFMNASCGAWLSTRLSNPRLSHFVNLLVLGIVVAAFEVFSVLLPISKWVLPGALILIGLFFHMMAVRGFHSDRIVQPISY